MIGLFIYKIIYTIKLNNNNSQHSLLQFQLKVFPDALFLVSLNHVDNADSMKKWLHSWPMHVINSYVNLSTLNE